MDGAIEIRYAGVVIGRGALQPDADDASGTFVAFVAFGDPLPVGTECELELPTGRRRVRVEHVVERGSGSDPGMTVRFVAGDNETAGVPETVDRETSSRHDAGSPPADQAAVTSRATIAYGVTTADLAASEHPNPDANGKPAAQPAAQSAGARPAKKKRR